VKRVIIFGCGFVGARAARLFAEQGWDVIGITRSQDSAEQLAGEPYRVLACDIGDPIAMAGAAELHGADAVISAVSSGRGGEDAYRQVYLRGLENVFAFLNPGRVLFVSSTSVYGQNDGEWVTEESPAEPVSPTSRVLREAEELALAKGGQVARLAGIYGPGRSVLLRKFLDGTAVIEGDGNRHINQIHADDAAAALLRLITGELPGGIYNVSDDVPVTQLGCYEWLAAALGRPLPPLGTIDLQRKRGVTNKRVSSRKLRSLGWTLRYSSYREALARDGALLAAARGDGSGDAPP
jgi:nucleoside-diphosphate-sugar epimerase